MASQSRQEGGSCTHTWIASAGFVSKLLNVSRYRAHSCGSQRILSHSSAEHSAPPLR